MLDWMAGTLELLGAWTIGNKKRYSFLLFAAGNLLWVSYAIINEVTYGLLLVCIPMCVINIRNFRKWGRNG